MSLFQSSITREEFQYDYHFVVEDKNNELLSKERQVEFSKERNSYRRIMLFVLLIVNIILAGLFYYLIMKN